MNSKHGAGAADAGKVAMDTDLAVVKYLQRNNKKLAVFACFHTFGDLDVFNIVVQTLEDGERPQFEVMAGIGCAVVDVVGGICVDCGITRYSNGWRFLPWA